MNFERSVLFFVEKSIYPGELEPCFFTVKFAIFSYFQV